MLLFGLNPIPAAVAGAVSATQFQIEPGDLRNLLLEAQFLYGSGGTSVDAWVQSSVDGGASWYDIANFHFTTAAAKKMANISMATPVTTFDTPGDGTLAANTVQDGTIGDKLRLKYTIVGTYAGASSLAIYGSGSRLRAA